MNNNTPENEDAWEMRVQQAARQFTYPPTPDLAGQLRSRSQNRLVMRRALQIVVVLLVIALASVIAVPEIRASVLEFLHIGAVRILQIEPTATPTSLTATPNGTPTPLASILDLPNETTLEQAREQVDFPISLPTYPLGIGLPDRVFVQDKVFDLVTLVWLKPNDQVWFSLHILNSFGFAEKGYVRAIDETEVNGEWAVWLTTPHPIVIQLSRSRYTDLVSWLIHDKVLLWEAGGLTYRIEGGLTLDEARAIADSLE